MSSISLYQDFLAYFLSEASRSFKYFADFQNLIDSLLNLIDSIHSISVQGLFSQQQLYLLVVSFWWKRSADGSKKVQSSQTSRACSSSNGRHFFSIGN